MLNQLLDWWLIFWWFIFQLRDSFKELKKRFSNLKFNYLKRNDRTRNMKAVRNQLQQVELYEEKLQVSPGPDLSLWGATDYLFRNNSLVKITPGSLVFRVLSTDKLHFPHLDYEIQRSVRIRSKIFFIYSFISLPSNFLKCYQDKMWITATGLNLRHDSHIRVAGVR